MRFAADSEIPGLARWGVAGGSESGRSEFCGERRGLSLRGVASLRRTGSVSPGVLDSGGVAPDALARLAQSVPGGVPGSPEAVLSPVRFLLSDAAAYVTGAELCVTGGWGL